MRTTSDHPPPALGDCPDCGATIPVRRLLIEYETAEGRLEMFAECPGCRDVVHPA